MSSKQIVPKTIVEFVSVDAQGVITKETWRATSLHCPRCGQKAPAVWTLISEPPLRVKSLTLPIFLCLGCRFVAVGLNGFDPQWSASDRVRQIIDYAFGEAESK